MHLAPLEHPPLKQWETSERPSHPQTLTLLVLVLVVVLVVVVVLVLVLVLVLCWW